MNQMSPSAIAARLKNYWRTGQSMKAAAAAMAMVAVFSIFLPIEQKPRSVRDTQYGRCNFPAIFNFGDSNSDTGAASAAFGRLIPPYGRTFFGKPAGRYSDGRLVVDFVAHKLGLPYLNAYLDSVGTSLRHGANYAASGTTIQPQDAKLCAYGFNPFTLDVQISQFEQFKARTTELYDQENSSDIRSSLPELEYFSRALYMFDIGQNDLHAGLTTMSEEQVRATIPRLIDLFSSAVEQLYRQGAKAFWIHNTGPIGCLPFFVVNYPPKPGNADEIGCLKSYNDVAQEFNRQLKDRTSELRKQFQDAALVYVDMYSVKYSLINNAKSYGFTDPLGCCCVRHKVGDCWNKVVVNGTEIRGGCSNPSEYISWDGIHYTEAANKWVAGRILCGSFSDPRVSISQACPKPL